MRVSKPYHRSGVALALPAGADGGRSFADLGQEEARSAFRSARSPRWSSSQRGLQTTPFGFEDEMIEAVARRHARRCGRLAGERSAIST